MKIALFGGTFDPIHNGHLIIAENCCSELGMNKVIFIPSEHPPHKTKKRITSINHRYRMVSMAVQDNDKFSISNIEITNKNFKYSYQTINYFKKIYPKDQLFFIIGTDSLLDLHKWKKGGQLLEMCKFIVVPRPDFELKKLGTIKNKIKKLPNTYLGISSTDIRTKTKTKKSIKYLVPDNIEQYINSKKLYK